MKCKVIFYDDITVLEESYDNKKEAKQRMSDYLGGYSTRLEIDNNDKRVSST